MTRTDILASSQSSGAPKSIFMLHLDIVGGCQLRCVGCPNSTLMPKVKQVPLDLLDRILAHIDVDFVHTLRLFNFGEPLLHEQFSEILGRLTRQRWRADHVEISTNAQHVYWEDFEEALKQRILTKLVVSCDGDGSAEAYERLRPPGKWSKFIDFLNRTKALRDRWHPELELTTRSVIETQSDMQGWREVVEPLGWTAEFRTWKALPESAENRTGRELKSPRGICTFVAPSDRFSHQYHGELNQLYVDWDGTVVPCCVHPKAGDLGSLADVTYSSLIAGPSRQAFLAQMEADRPAMSICGQCEYGPPENPGPSFEDNLPAL